MSVYYMTSSELSHHGVKGMKWGVRKAEKYDAQANRYASKESKARTNMMKNYYGRNRIVARANADRARAKANETTLRGKLRQDLGAEASERSAKANAAYYNMKASRAKSEKQRTAMQAREYNNQQMAKHWRNTIDSSKSYLKRATYNNKNIMKVPLKTLKGKDTTYGKEFAKAVAVTVAVNAISAASAY